LADFVELQIESGATFITEIVVREGDGTSKNLVSYSARSQMRKSYYSSTATNFTIQITDAANGVISMGVSAANTANISPGRYVYDVEIDNGQGVVTRIFEGIVTVSPNVTRS
jgi:hypothetical protein